MRYNTWPETKPKQRRFQAWRSCPAFGRLDLEKHWSPKTRVTRSMRRLEACSSDSEPVAGPSGLQQTSHTGQGSDGRVLSGKRKREDAFEMKQERDSPSKKSRSKSPRPENISNERKTPDEDSAEQKEQSRALPPFIPIPAIGTVTEEEASRNVDDLFAKYRIIKKLAAGGYGIVYAGRRIEDDFPVAIKKIKKKMASYIVTKVDGVMLKLPKEVALLIRLGAGPENSSCNITPLLLDWYDLGEHVVLVFERPEPCVDMLQYIIAGGAETGNVEEAKIIFRQLVELAIEMEARGVFHRDIKPDNVLIETGSDVLRARFIDFGCGTICTPERIFQRPKGTIAYSSSDWFQQFPYNARLVTVRQLGLVLYDFLFRQRPLVNEQSIGSTRAVPISRSVPEECRDFLNGCLAKDPKKRLSLEDMRNHPWLNSE